MDILDDRDQSDVIGQLKSAGHAMHGGHQASDFVETSLELQVDEELVEQDDDDVGEQEEEEDDHEELTTDNFSDHVTADIRTCNSCTDRLSRVDHVDQGFLDDDDAADMHGASAATRTDEVTRLQLDQVMQTHDMHPMMTSVRGKSKNTLRRNAWAYKTFTAWATDRNIRADDTDKDDAKVVRITKDIAEMDVEELNCCLSAFVMDARKTDGKAYSRRSLHNIFMGLQGYIKVNFQRDFSFLEDKCFERFRRVFDSVARTSPGTGSTLDADHYLLGLPSSNKQQQQEDGPGSTGHAELSLDEERLWQSKQLGDHNPKVLLRTILYLNGKNFRLRGGQSHRNLTCANIRVGIMASSGHEYIEYTESANSARNGNHNGSKHQRLTPRTARHFADRRTPERCHVRIFKKYMSVRPDEPRDAFYLAPSSINAHSNGLWFSPMPIGHNALSKVKKELLNRNSNHHVAKSLIGSNDVIQGARTAPEVGRDGSSADKTGSTPTIQSSSRAGNTKGIKIQSGSGVLNFYNCNVTENNSDNHVNNGRNTSSSAIDHQLQKSNDIHIKRGSNVLNFYNCNITINVTK